MTAPASAHVHPTPTELAAPGVVYVEAGARVEVALVEHQIPAPHLTIVQSTSNPVLQSASGFVVDPTGAVVTSGVIHPPTAEQVNRASVYAVNEAFKKRYPGRLRASGTELFDPQRIGSDADPLQQRLEACYPPNTTNDAGGCVVSVTPTYVVYPHVIDQAKYGRLPAELVQASTSDVAVLRVRGGSGMPTVNLGQSTDGAQALSVLGFTAVPDPKKPAPAIQTHLADVGSHDFKTKLKPEEAADNGRLAEGLRNGMLGGPAVAEKGQVVGFLVPEPGSGPPPAQPGRLIDAAAIRKVLDDAGVEAHQGTVDATFESASHNFKNKYFADSIPDLERTIELYPGHALAAIDLAVAEQNVAQGNPSPATPTEGNSAATGSETFPWTVVLSAVAALLVLAAVAVIVLRRNRKASESGGGDHGGPRAPGPPKPRAGKPGTVRAREGTPRAATPHAATPGDPSRTGTGLRERPKVPSGVAGEGAVSVAEGRGAGQGGAPSRSVPGQRAADAGGNGSAGESRAVATPAPGNSQAFCTHCGAALGPHHRFCGRCGRPTG